MHRNAAGVKVRKGITMKLQTRMDQAKLSLAPESILPSAIGNTIPAERGARNSDSYDSAALLVELGWCRGHAGNISMPSARPHQEALC